MQAILGATGQIAIELARELKRSYTDDLRLISRNPRQVNGGDALVAANLLDEQQTRDAVKSAEVVYFTAGLPPDTQLWESQFPTMLRNALSAARSAGAKFVYFDNTYNVSAECTTANRRHEVCPCGAQRPGARGHGNHGAAGNAAWRYSGCHCQSA